jgi:hypothetical protein
MDALHEKTDNKYPRFIRVLGGHIHKIEPVLTISILINLRIAIYRLEILTNRLLLFFQIKKIISNIVIYKSKEAHNTKNLSLVIDWVKIFFNLKKSTLALKEVGMGWKSRNHSFGGKLSFILSFFFLPECLHYCYI